MKRPPMKHHAMKTKRRDFLKASALLGLSAGAPLLMNACGGGDDDPPPPPAETRQARHLHFDLSHNQIAEPRLHALRSAHHKAPLQAHTAETRAQHRALNPALANVPDQQLTHFIADADLPAHALQSIYVMGKHPSTGAPVLGGLHLAIPGSARQAVARRRAAERRQAPQSAKRQAYRLEQPLAVDPSADLDAFMGPFDVATFLVFHHPEVMNLNAELGTEIVDRIQAAPCAAGDDSCIPYIGTLAVAIANRISQAGYPTTTPGSWCTLEAQTFEDGSPLLDGNGEQVWRFELDDEIAATTGTVVRDVLKGVFDDPMFEGTNWHATTGITSQPASAAAALAPVAKAAREVAAAAGDSLAVAADHPVGSTLSGIEMTALAVTDVDARGVRLTVRNRYLRFLSVYVQYFDVNGVALAVEAPSELDSPTAKFLTLVPTNEQIMGIPYQGDDVARSDIDFIFPDGAASATIKFGSLGLGGDAFTREAVAGASMTLALNIGLPTVLLALGIRSDVLSFQQSLAKLMTSKITLELFLKNLITAVTKSAPQLVEGVYVSGQTSSVQPFISGVANFAIQALLANAPDFAARLVVAGVAAAMQSAIPLVNVAFRVLATLADLAAIATSVGESLASPAITTNTISLSMDTTVRIKRDPRDFQFPASARRYVVEATYDGGATPRTAEGTIAQGTVDPIDAVLSGVPSGGKVKVKVSLYSDDGCLVGVKQLDPIDNLPATASLVEVEIVELLAVLNAQTQYQHSLKLGYENGSRTWQTATAPTATRSSLCAGQDDAICALNGITVHTASGMAGYGFNAGGQNVNACGGGSGGALNTIQNLFLGQNPDSGLKFSSCGSADPIGIVYDASGPAAGGHHFFLQPAADGYQLRQITLDTASGFVMNQTLSWGRFSSALDSLAVTPSGWVVGVNRTTHKMEILQLPSQAIDQANAPQSVPFAAMTAGIGTRAGLLDTPVAVASGPGNAILVLEQGNRRVQAFDIAANPVRLFSSGTSNLMPLPAADTDAVYLDLAVEGLGYMYVLSYVAGGTAPEHYRLDVYKPDGTFLSRTTGVSVARVAVDLFRNVYTLNYEPLAGAPKVEPTLSQWLPVTPNVCPSTLPTSAASAQRESTLAACGPRSWLSRLLHA